MITISKNKMLLIAVVILLLTNIGMLLFFLYNRGGERKDYHGAREEMMTSFLQKDIGFNKHQMEQFDSLSKTHRETVRALFDEVRSRKELQFKQLTAADFSDSSINAIAMQSTDKQKQVEIQMFLHLREVRKLCTKEQLPKFDSLFYKVWNRRGENRRRQEK